MVLRPDYESARETYTGNMRSLPVKASRGLVLLLAVVVSTWTCAQVTPLTFEQTACSSEEVFTSAGPVCGLELEIEDKTVSAFLGIPYAESTAGENRLEPPVPVAQWSQTYRATAFGPACPQNKQVEGIAQSEDCLSINVWRPAGPALASPLPVLVFIHGGAFVEGSSADPLIPGEPYALYDGAYLAATQNLVVVTLNYRLGVLGFLAGSAGRTGNYGLQDQQLALHWVQDNIAAFGGNPDLVTLAGESAGAMSVGLHLLSVPSSDALFGAAILQSNPFGLPYKTPQQALATAETYLLAVGCKFRFDQAACLKSKPVEALLDAQNNPYLGFAVLDYGLAAFINWAPIIDGDLVVAQPISRALEPGIAKPTLLGTNTDEGTVFFAGPAARPLGNFGYATFARALFGPENAEAVLRTYPPTGTGDNTGRIIEVSTDYIFTCSNRAAAQRTQAPLYLYEFAHAPSFNIWTDVGRCATEACHGDELAFVFHSAAGERSFTAEEATLSKTMVDYWGSFASALHNPNRLSPVRWPDIRSGEAYLRLGLTPATEVLDTEACAFWDALGYPIEEELGPVLEPAN